jgi:hypothetical protein
VEKRGIRISKTVLKAQAISLGAIILATVIVYTIIVNVPGSAFEKLKTFESINNNNPGVLYSNYFQKQSAIADMEDSFIVTPLAFFLGAIFFGNIVTLKRTATYLAKWAAVTGVALSLLIFAFGFFGNYAEVVINRNTGSSVPLQSLDARYFLTGSLQTAYCTVMYVLGAFAGAYLHRTITKSPGSQPTGSLPAASTK